MSKNIGICESCGCIIDTSCDTNYNKTLFICRYCKYPNKIIINKKLTTNIDLKKRRDVNYGIKRHY